MDMKLEFQNGNQFNTHSMVKITVIAIATGMQSLHDLDIVH